MDIKQTFDNEASEYEFTSRAVNIYFDEALDTLVKSIKVGRKNNISILDVCCGTGILTEKVAKLFPKAKIIGVDFSTGMIDIAKTRLKDFDCDFVICDVCDSEAMSKLGEFDLVISSFGIHNVHGYKNKQLALKNVIKHLKSGGQYITCDLVNGRNKEEIERFAKFQKEWLLKTYLPAETDEWIKLLAEEDDPETLEDNYKLLQNAGLKDLTLHWQKQFLAIWGGVKK